MNRGLCGSDDRLLRAGPWLAGLPGRLGAGGREPLSAPSWGMLVVLVVPTKDALFSVGVTVMCQCAGIHTGSGGGRRRTSSHLLFGHSYRWIAGLL